MSNITINIYGCDGAPIQPEPRALAQRPLEEQAAPTFRRVRILNRSRPPAAPPSTSRKARLTQISYQPYKGNQAGTKVGYQAGNEPASGLSLEYLADVEDGLAIVSTHTLSKGLGADYKPSLLRIQFRVEDAEPPAHGGNPLTPVACQVEVPVPQAPAGSWLAEVELEIERLAGPASGNAIDITTISARYHIWYGNAQSSGALEAYDQIGTVTPPT